MTKIKTLIAYPINAKKIETKFGERVIVTFTYEVEPSEKDTTFYHTEKHLKVVELSDTPENFNIFLNKKIACVELEGFFVNYNFKLIGYKLK